MNSGEIRQAFLLFFAEKQHHIVPSAPIVVKNDPTLLFTNAGMNQFKDYFLGNKQPPYKRIADTQKCLRVSGKHNDLEEVGVDTYHHTMFEMLGNWSFGDYFKKEAIAWSWELLTNVLKLDKNNLYVTIFEGDVKEQLPRDDEAYEEWKKWIDEDRILLGNKKDNFWEMGDTGPCGPCTEIHVDCRSAREKAEVPGKTLVNADHPQVIEIWNNVFIQYNRLKDGRLEPLPARHVDTGMGFERLVRVLQGKQSNYDTDIFTGTIAQVEKLTGANYDYGNSKKAIAFRVIADHIRAIAFTIADGQLPSNTGAGYVIRRILRRAVRYYYSYLDYKQPLLYKLMPVLAQQFADVFPELQQQLDFVSKVVKEEEDAFLRTLEKALLFLNEIIRNIFEIAFLKQLLLQKFSYEVQVTNKSHKLDIVLIENNELVGIEFLKNDFKSLYLLKPKEVGVSKIYTVDIRKGIRNNLDIQKIEHELKCVVSDESFYVLDGKQAFELYDTYGFPFDLTKLIMSDYGIKIDEAGFEIEMQQQKQRSRAATAIDTEDWIVLHPETAASRFVGYEQLQAQTQLIKYRKVKAKNKEAYQLVLGTTPFYAESGGQVGDTGTLLFGAESIPVTDTKKENNLTIQFTETLPEDPQSSVTALVDAHRRQAIRLHHTATHLLHAALRNVLGTHVTQKGSLVNEHYLRFDFAHFAKLTESELAAVEALVNEKIRANIPVAVKEMNKDEAVALGAMALFGEKYGDQVRVVIIDPAYSIELCGGTHAGATGELGSFKITQETAVAAGVRRMEAVCGLPAEQYINGRLQSLDQLSDVLKNPKDIQKAVTQIQAENNELKKRIESLENKQLELVKQELLKHTEKAGTVNFIGAVVDVPHADALKKLAALLKPALQNFVTVLAANLAGKPQVVIMVDEALVTSQKLDAVHLIKSIAAPLIKGGGGGQSTLAAAGGQDAGNLQQVIDAIRKKLPVE